ncbi:MAG: hypothetical protein COC24_017495 [Alphaproteobacteria bacterium]|nr:hypothetical protein [Alphaproteobacteria bacterium]
MTTVGISEISCELGQPVDAIEGWARYYNLDDGFLARMQRNDVCHFRNARGSLPRELCVAAVDNVLHKSARDLSSFGGTIHFHSLHSSAPLFGTSYRAFLRERGLPNSAFFISVSDQRCIGFHLALKIAQAQLEQYPTMGAILLFGGDVALDERQRNIDGLAIESDASSAAIVEHTDRCQILSTKIRTEGRFFEHDKPYDTRRYQITALKEIGQLIQNVLENSSVDIGELDAIITHNGNLDMWRRVFRAFGISESKHFRDNFASIGHTNCSDFPINLMALLEKAVLRDGAYVLVLTIAYGRSFGCTLIKI